MTATADPRASRETLKGVRETRMSPVAGIELREVPRVGGGVDLKFSGFASVTGQPYSVDDALGSYEETIHPGAYTATLNARADVILNVDHSGLPLARTGGDGATLNLTEVTDPDASPIPGLTGLWVDARLDPENPTVRVVRSAVQRGDLSAMSHAFHVVRGSWGQDYLTRSIREVNMNRGGDVSIVTWAANVHTEGTVNVRGRRGRPATVSLVVLPDSTSRAKLNLAQYRARRTSQLDSTDAVSEARRRLSAARARHR
jgi:HK97 family phage prohead protease